MKTEKINFNAVKNSLSRTEMKKIMAGSGGASMKCCWNGTNNCSKCASGSVCVSGAYLTPC